MADISSTASTTSTSSTSSTTGTVSNGHYWGLASGLDVDSIVTGLLSDQQSKIDKEKQQEQTLEWQQSAYQGITTQLQTFESSYLELGQSSSMASSNMYVSYAASSSNPILTATAGADATGAAQNVTITQTATTATITGGATSSTITGGTDMGGNGLSALKTEAAAAEAAGLSDPSLSITVDGVAKTISFSSSDLSGISDSAGMLTLINQKLSDSFGSVPELNADGSVVTDGNGTVTEQKVVASLGDSGNLQLNAASGYQSVISISATSTGFDTRLLGAEAQTADSLGTSEPSISITYNGTSQTINFTKDDDLSSGNIQSTIQDKIDAAFGAGSGLTASVDASTGKLTIKNSSDTNVSYTTSNTNLNALSALGLTNGQSNRLNTTSTTLQQLFDSKGLTLNTDSNGDFHVNINGQDINLGTADTSISSAFSTIDTSKAGVTISYNSTDDTVSVSSNQSGASGDVDLSGDTSGFFTALGMTSDDISNKATGNDAILTINGNSYTRSTNNFTIDGVSYSINSPVTADETPQTATVSLAPNTSALSTGINNFISAYNTLITSIYAQIDTEPNTNYPPLTSEQAAEMTTDQVTEWNTTAQQGILYNDDTLEGILDSMRTALYQPVTLSNGNTVSLFDFGITTSDDPDDHGTLEIKSEDEQTFQNALSNDAGEMEEFFTKESDIPLDIAATTSDTESQQQQRTQGEGLVDRLDDVIQTATSTVGGVPGSLLTIAGMTGDPTQYNNTIYNELTDLNQTITDYTTELTDQQNRYYTEFENLETYMSEANSQSASLTSMTSGGSSS